MNNLQISTHSQIVRRIVELKAAKYVQEEELKITYRRIIGTIDLISVFNGGMPNPGKDINSTVKVGLNILVNLITDYIVLNKNRSMKGLLSTVMIKKFTTSLINNNFGGIISGISSLLRHKTQFEKSQEFNH